MRARRLVLTSVAVVAVLVPSSATTADRPSAGVLRAKLAGAIAAEKRALVLLAKKPPRTRTAELALQESRAQLRELLGFGGWRSLEPVLRDAENGDRLAAHFLTDPGGDYGVELAQFWIADALEHKSVLMASLNQPATATGPQCADRRDNDGDGTIDARHDSGCSSAKDGTERSSLTCSLGYTAGTPISVLQGTCSGPFEKIQVIAPAGTAFDTGSPALVEHARACRYASPQKLECVMSDGVANPRHVVRGRFRFRKRSALRPRVLIRDFAGRGRTWPVAPSQTPPDAAHLRFRLTYSHAGSSSFVCASIEADSGASLDVSMTGPSGYAASGTLQLKKKEHKTAPGGFSFRISQFGTYRVTIVSRANGKIATRTRTIEVTSAPGDPRCSATGAPPP